jgi:hypothetical protein
MNSIVPKGHIIRTGTAYPLEQHVILCIDGIVRQDRHHHFAIISVVSKFRD